MISHKYLNNKKGAAYSYFQGLSSTMVSTILLAAFQILFFVGLPLYEFISINSSEHDAVFVEAEKADKKYDFLIYGLPDLTGDFITYIVLAVIGLLSIFTAVRLFSFICDKKTVNVYYSLGIKRTTLFFSKYAAGATALALAHMIPVILSYIVNVIFLGPSIRMSFSLIHMFTGFFIFSLIFYSVTACVFASVGTVSEAVVHSVILIFSPTVLIFVVEQIISALLPSSPYDSRPMHFSGIYEYTSQSSLLASTAKYNPLLFFAKDIMNYSCGTLNDGAVISTGTSKAWAFPLTFMLIPWFAVCLAFTLLGLFLFKHVKAENCGFLNTNKILGNYSIFVLCFFASTLFFGEIQYSGYTSVFTVGAILAFAVYLIAEIFLKRNFKKIVTSLYKFAAHAVVIALILGTVMTDVFGYSSFIPNKNKVKSVELSAPFSYAAISTDDMKTFSMSMDMIQIPEFGYTTRFLPEFTSSKDIDTVMNIHKALIENDTDDGTVSKVLIRYNYNDGTHTQRLIPVTNKDNIELLFTLFDTDAYKNELKNIFFRENRKEYLKNYFKNSNFYYDSTSCVAEAALEYEYSNVLITSSSLYEHNKISLSQEQFNKLKTALYNDLSATSAKEFFLGNAKQLGVISFEPTQDAVDWFEQEIYGNTYTEPGMIITPDVVIDGDYDNEIIDEDESGYYEYQTYSLGNYDRASSYDVIITESMTETLNFLNETGYRSLLDTQYQIEAIRLKNCDYSDMIYYDNAFIYDFYAYSPSPEYYTAEKSEYAAIEDNFSMTKITDAQSISKLNDVMKLHEYSYPDGYLCLVKYTNDVYCMKYVSAEDLPDGIVNNNA